MSNEMSPYTLLTLHRCPICGRQFLPAPLHRYREHQSKTAVYVCSYTCSLKGQKLHEEKLENEKQRKRRKKNGKSE
jgi:hypothetical protein